jgi:hypothetical protein
MTDEEAGKPKYLSDTLRNDQTVSDKDATIGIDATEAAASGSIAKGLGTPGWVRYTTYTDSNGNTRHKSEVLVAAGSMATDGTTTLVDDLNVSSGAPSSPPSGGAPSSPPSSGTTYTGWTSGANQGVVLSGTQLNLYAYPSNNLNALFTAAAAASAGTAISFVIGGTTYNATLASPTTGGGGPSLPYINIQAGSGVTSGNVTSIIFG